MWRGQWESEGGRGMGAAERIRMRKRECACAHACARDRAQGMHLEHVSVNISDSKFYIFGLRNMNAAPNETELFSTCHNAACLEAELLRFGSKGYC